MAKGFTFQLEGIDKVLKGLNKLPTELKQRVAGEIESSANLIARNAKRDVAKDDGKAAQGISAFKVGEMTFEVVSNAAYSAYIEFGTGAYVVVPDGLESYAAQFKGAGVKKVNLPARPFLFNNFQIEKVKLIDRLKKVLKDL